MNSFCDNAATEYIFDNHVHDTVHIGYSDNAGGIDFWAKLSLYPINYVWISWRRGFIPRDNNITISNITTGCFTIDVVFSNIVYCSPNQLYLHSYTSSLFRG